MASAFNTEAFENTVVEQEMETKYTPLIESSEVGAYVAFIESHVGKEYEGQPILSLQFKVTDEKAQQQFDAEDVFVKHDIWLDGAFSEDGKLTLDFGPNKNVRLGKLRALLGQNDGQAWGFSRLDGAGPVNIFIRHRPDKNDPEIKYNEIVKMTVIG
jgi:hypothetical protein